MLNLFVCIVAVFVILLWANKAWQKSTIEDEDTWAELKQKEYERTQNTLENKN